MSFQYHNYPAHLSPPPSPLPSTFELTAPSDTDIWKKPPSHSAFSAPICSRTLKLSSFRRARVSVSAEWKTLYDQGGLCLIFPPQDKHRKPARWIKTGIEVYGGIPNVSTVVCDRWADWSLVPLPASAGGQTTIEMEREVEDDGQLGSTLVVYMVEGGLRRPIREATWVFEDVSSEEEDQDGPDVWVGVYAAKPTKDKEDAMRELKVIFEGLEIETA